MRCLGSIDINNVTYPLAQLSDYSFIRSTEDFRWVYKDGSATQQYIASAGTDFIPILKPYPTTFGESAYKPFSNYRAKFEYWSYRNQSGPQDLRIGIRIDDEENTILSSGGWGYDDSYLRLYVAIVLDDANEYGYIVYSYYVQGEHPEQYADGYGMCINGGNSTLGRIIYDVFGYNGGGAGSGYIGNSLLSNKKMVGYNVPTSSAESTKTESVNEVSAGAVSSKPKSGNGYARIEIIEDFDNDSIYGFVEDMSITNPSQRITYICKNKNYTPLTINLNGNHLVNYNSWSGFPVLAENIPCMVKSDGRADYKLNETTYSQKAGGGNSDVSNTSYNGAGAFSWINKIYSKFSIYGNKKVVMFSTVPKTGFEAIGFKTNDNTELEGIWLPMFYGVNCSGTYKSIAGQWATSETLFSEDKTGIENIGNRARFFGGSIVSVINELLTMFSKSPDMLSRYGYGQSDAWRYAPYDDQHHGMAANTIIDGGQFYGDLVGRYCNKILHSMMLGTHSFMLKDPYVNIKNGKVSVSKYYNVDTDGTGYDETFVDYGNKGLSSNWHIPLGYKVINDFGFFLDYSRDGYSTSDGTCSGIAIKTSVSNGIMARYGAGMDAILINGYYLCDARGSFLDDTRGFWYNSTPMMLPPVGYKPN